MTVAGDEGTLPDPPRAEAMPHSLAPVLRQRRRALLAAAGGFLLLALACALAAFLAWRTVRASDAVLHSAEARRAAITVTEGLLAVESAQRAVLLARDAPERAALGEEEARLGGLLALLSGPEGAALRAAVRHAEAQLRATLDRPAEAPAAALRDPAARQAMAEARQAAAALVAAANASLERIAMRQRHLGT
jgi:hypothetical protein